MPTCDVVIPCRDEAAALPALLARVPPAYGVIVVDNGSQDGTGRVAAGLGATVVTETRAGYGAAVHAGVLASTAQFVAVMDGDGSMDPQEIAVLLSLVLDGGADLACGRRRATARGVWPWHARIGNLLVLAWLRRRTGIQLRDIAPLRVCGREALLELNVMDRRFGYPVELLDKAQRAGWRMVEHDVTYRPRAAGTRSKVSGSVRGSIRAAADFARVLS